MTGLYFFQIEVNVDKSLKSLTDKRAEEMKVRFQFRQRFGLANSTLKDHKIYIECSMGYLQFYIIFISISVIIRQWESENERLCALDPPLPKTVKIMISV